MITERPLPSDYEAYFGQYIDLVPTGDLHQVYQTQMESVYAQIAGLSEREGEFRYADGKWSVKEIIGHLSDAERMFGYQIFCMARGYSAPIPPLNLAQCVIQGSFIFDRYAKY